MCLARLRVSLAWCVVCLALSCGDGDDSTPSTSNAPSTVVRETTVCEVAAKAQHLNGRMIMVRAHVAADIHHTALRDGRCPGVFLVLSRGASVLNEQRLIEATHGRSRSRDDDIQAVVVGTLRNDRHGRRLEMSKVVEVAVTRRQRQDDHVFVDNAVRALYLQPLGMNGASIRIKTVRRGADFTALVVHVYEKAAPNASEILTVEVIRAGSHLQYISATGSGLTGSRVDGSERDRRIATGALMLGAFGGYSTDGRQHSARPGFIEVRFTHPQPPSHLSGTATAVFARDSGLLVTFGTPAVPPSK